MSYIVPCRHVSILLTEQGGCIHSCPPHRRPLSRNSLGTTQNTAFFPGVMTAKMELWLIHLLGSTSVPPWLEQGMAAKGQRLPSSQRPSGVLGVSTLSLRPSPLSPAQGRQPCPLMPGCLLSLGVSLLMEPTSPRWTWGRVRHWNEGEGLDQEPSLPPFLWPAPQHLTGS